MSQWVGLGMLSLVRGNTSTGLTTLHYSQERKMILKYKHTKATCTRQWNCISSVDNKDVAVLILNPSYMYW